MKANVLAAAVLLVAASSENDFLEELGKCLVVAPIIDEDGNEQCPEGSSRAMACSLDGTPPTIYCSQCPTDGSD